MKQVEIPKSSIIKVTDHKTPEELPSYDLGHQSEFQRM